MIIITQYNVLVHTTKVAPISTGLHAAIVSFNTGNTTIMTLSADGFSYYIIHVYI